MQIRIMFYYVVRNLHFSVPSINCSQTFTNGMLSVLCIHVDLPIQLSPRITLKVFQNGRPDTSACEDITPRNLCIHSILII